MRKKIGECLIQAGLITEDDLQTALAEHKRTGERVGVVLVRMNLATEKQIAKALALQLGFPYINLAENPPDPTAVVLIPKEVSLKRVCIAVGLEKNLLTVSGCDRQQVGQVAAEIRELRPPDVYKLKGIRYADEILRKKAGKTGAK